MNTDIEKPANAAAISEKPAFMGSGFGPAGRPGMTREMGYRCDRTGTDATTGSPMIRSTLSTVINVSRKTSR